MQADRFDPERGKAIHWMTSIVRHIAIDMVRHNTTRPERAIDLDDVEIPVGPHGTDALDIERCMDGLDALQARAIHLAMQFGLSHSELATTLKQPLGTLKSAIRRGLLKLRSCLEGEPSHA
jgi:RNA polymerase sigma-70 factor (ECF subfamily)